MHDTTRDVRAFAVKVSNARGDSKLVDCPAEVADIQSESQFRLVAILGCFFFLCKPALPGHGNPEMVLQSLKLLGVGNQVMAENGD